MLKKGLCVFLIIVIVLNISFIGINILNYINVNKLSTLKINNPEKLSINTYEEIDINSEYIEPELSDDIKILGEVNPNEFGKYIIKYSYTSNELVTLNKYKIVKIVDKEAPKIKLKGSDNISLYVGDTFKDKGIDVSDNSSEDLSKNVIIEGKVNTKKVGKYKIKYTVKDSSGNESSIIRNVTIKNRPVIKKIAVTKVASVEKGNVSKKKVDLSTNSNSVVAMNFNSNGFYIKGYLKNGSGKYTLNLCSDKCSNFSMNSSSKYYSGSVNIKNMSNGTYKLKITNKKQEDVINTLDNTSKLSRAKVGNKLVTFIYSKKLMSVKIEDFKYAYDILIDPGHGGSDDGASNSKIKEKTLNLTQSLYEKSRYEQHGLKVKMIRTDDSYGIMMGDSSEPRVRRRAYAIGYYGAVSRVVYSNHHNSITNNYYSGWEIILPAKASSSSYSVPLSISKEWKKLYPVGEEHTRIYTRNYDTGEILNKASGQTYNVKNWYAIIRIPYELNNVNVVLYEGTYLSNMDDYNWYSKNWKTLSEVKIKKYVESLGKTYIPV